MKCFNAGFGSWSVRFLYLLGGVCFFLAYMRLTTDSVTVSAGITPTRLSLAGDRATFPPHVVTQAIETIQVGQRVVSVSPNGAMDLSLGTDEAIEADKWARVEIRSPKRDGTSARVVLLRPRRWVEEHGAAPGHEIEFSVPECGIIGVSTVLTVSSCPRIEPGHGSVVIGTYCHESAVVYDYDVLLENGDRLTATGNHPIWSADRGTYVHVAELGRESLVLTLNGEVPVRSVIQRSERQTVYNIETAVIHTYSVGYSGVVVHNTVPTPANPCEELVRINEVVGTPPLRSDQLPAGDWNPHAVDGRKAERRREWDSTNSVPRTRFRMSSRTE